ncbi:MAG: PAS domain-containing protein [Planctomycetes bacterium]|nr:PAS domain-containing protein [Planctomycetota bacterium]
MKIWGERIRVSIIVPLGLALLALLMVSVITIYRLQSWHINENARAHIASMQELFRMELEEDAKLLSGLIDCLEHDETMREACITRDRAKLLSYSQPLFEELHSKYDVTHFYFHGLDKVCLLRIHKPEFYGDRIERFTLDKAVREGKPAHGMELGPLGTFTLRVVHPGRIDDKLIGYIELGKEIEYIMPEMKRILGGELIFFIDKSYLNRTDWEEGMKLMGRVEDWEQFSQGVVIDKTIKKIPLALGSQIERHYIEHEKFIFEISIDNRKYHCGFVPLLDAAGHNVGEIIVMNDVTEDQAALRALLITLIAICVPVGAALLGFFYFYIGRIERKLAKAHDSLVLEIDERNQAEESVRQKSQFLTTVIESLRHPFYVINVEDYTIAMANAATRKLGDINKQITCYALTHDRDLPCGGEGHICPLEEIKRTKKPATAEHTHYDKDGNPLIYEIRSFPIFDEESKLKQVIEYTIDITERKKAEEEISNLAKFPDENPNPVVRISQDGTILYVNKASSCLLKVWRRSAGEVLPDSWQKHISKTLASGKPSETEIKCNGRIFSLTFAPIPKADYVNIYALDITERKRAEEELRASETKSLTLLEGSPVCNKIIGLDFRLLYMSAAGVKRLKIPDIKRYYGKVYPPSLFSKSMRALLTEHLERAKAGEITSVEALAHDTEGGEVWYHTTFVPARNDKGQIEYIIATSVDITRRKQVEEEREQLVRTLNLKNKELESILYVASHDLRTPLVNIQGFGHELSHDCELVKSAMGDGRAVSEIGKEACLALKNSVPEALGFILTSATRMDAVLSGLLRISRLGQAALKIERLNMNSTIAGVVSNMEYQVKEAGVTLDIEQLPPCLGDASQISQVFSNLLDNVLKYLDEHRAGLIRVSGRTENNISIYCVEDNGVGIAPAHQEKIFEIFHRLEPEKGSGEGLGLTIVRRILDRHNGEVWVESELGLGSKFFVSLPAV